MKRDLCPDCTEDVTCYQCATEDAAGLQMDHLADMAGGYTALRMEADERRENDAQMGGW